MISKTSRPMQDNWPPRCLRESHEYAAEKAAIEPDARRIDRIIFGFDFVLARHPELGQDTDRQNVWALAVRPPRLFIFYSFNEHFVDLLGIHRRDPAKGVGANV